MTGYAAPPPIDRLVDSIAGGIITEVEARRVLVQVREEIDALQAELAHQAAPPVQLPMLDKFEGINLADYSMEEKRELLSIVVKEIKLRFDRLFITYNLYEAPGQLYTGRVDILRTPAHNSKLRQR